MQGGKTALTFTLKQKIIEMTFSVDKSLLNTMILKLTVGNAEFWKLMEIFPCGKESLQQKLT